MKITIFHKFAGVCFVGVALFTPSLGQTDNTPTKRELVARLIETQACVGCDLSGSDLNGLNLSGANLSGAVLTKADLSGARLSDANLSDANLVGANLQGAILNRANLIGTDLSNANLSASRLLEADLQGANLTAADLRWAKFRQTDIRNATMVRANLTKAEVAGWFDDGAVFCETLEPNGTLINRDCYKLAAQSKEVLSQPSSEDVTNASIEPREADWAVLSDVGRAQRMLSKLGYSAGSIDGIWGQSTRSALEEFLASRGQIFDGSFGANEIDTLESAAAESGIKEYPSVEWSYRSALISFGGYEFADQPVFDMIKTIRDMPSFGLNTVTLDFRCIGLMEADLPAEYPLGRRMGCAIANKQILEDEGFASTRRDATSLAMDEARAAGLAVNLRPAFAELARRFEPRDAAGYGTVPLDVFFDGDGQTWSGYVPIIMAVARYAQENQAEYLTIGVELNNLNSAIEADARWPEILEKIRSVYDGKLIYAHNYNNDSDIRRLPASHVMRHVDIVGLNFFPNQIMGGRKDYSAESVAIALQRARLENGQNMMDEAERLRAGLDVPVLLTESHFPTWRGSANWIFRGGCDYQNAGRTGWDFTQGPLQEKKPSDEHGRVLAAAFMLAFEDANWVHGTDYIFWSVAHAFDDRTDTKEFGPCSSWLWNSDDGIKELIRDFHSISSK